LARRLSAAKSLFAALKTVLAQQDIIGRINKSRVELYKAMMRRP